MKRIYLLVILLVAAASNTFAQRSINLEITMTSPTSSQTIERGKAFDLKAVCKNLGPDSLKAADSVLWYVTLSGSPLNFTFGSQTGQFWNRFNEPLKVGDTFHFNYPSRVLTYTQGVDSNRTLCFNVMPRFNGGGSDTIEDKTLSNNSSCVTMKFIHGWPAGVEEEMLVTEAGVNKAVVYPNPAKINANVAVEMSNNADVTVSIMDLSGRVVFQSATQYLEKGRHTIPLNTGSLQTGLYVYRVQMGTNVSSGKLSVTH